MVNALFVIVRALRTVLFFELVAAGLLVAGSVVLWGTGAGLLVGGVCAALKSYDIGGS